MAHTALIFFVTFLLLEYCESNKALRKLNVQFNLLKLHVEKDISDLQYEIADLQTQLELEKSRTSALEALLNSPDASIPDLTGTSSLTTLQKRIDRQDNTITKLEKDVKNIKKGKPRFKNLRDAIKSQERDLSNIKESVKQQKTDVLQLKTIYQTDSKNISVLVNKVTALGDGLENTVMESFAVVSKAFSDEKKQLQELLKNMADKDYVQSTVENSTDLTTVHEINEIQEQVFDLGTELSQVMEELNESSERISSNEVKLKVLNDMCKDADFGSNVTQVTTARPVTTGSSSSQSSEKNYTVYAIAIKDIPNNIRLGSRVIRGKRMRQADRYAGPGTVVKWNNNNKWAVVQWDSGNAPITTAKADDLYIITGGNDEHLIEAGFPRFEPIFYHDLEAAITIGTRVIRGEDWDRGEQDAGGPGTVFTYHNKKYGDVLVKWDTGTISNYRVGAKRKYDLFILAHD